MRPVLNLGLWSVGHGLKECRRFFGLRRAWQGEGGRRDRGNTVQETVRSLFRTTGEIEFVQVTWSHSRDGSLLAKSESTG